MNFSEVYSESTEISRIKSLNQRNWLYTRQITTEDQPTLFRYVNESKTEDCYEDPVVRTVTATIQTVISHSAEIVGTIFY